MSACEDKELLLQGLLDGELDAANTLACEAHLHQCPACTEEFERLRALRERLRTPGVAFEPTAQLRGRVLEALAREQGRAAPVAVSGRAASVDSLRPPGESALPDRGVTGPTSNAAVAFRSRRTSKVFSPWAAGGAIAALAACLAFVTLVRLPAQGVADELVAGHVRSMLATHLVDVVTSDRHVVKPWFEGKVDFAPPVLELLDQGFPLVGGRLDYIHGRVVAAVVYRRRQHIINVFVWPAGPTDQPAAASARHDGYNVIGWKQGELQFYAVSDVDPADLQLLRAAFIARAGG